MSASDYAIGVAIACCSTFLSASGLTLQKLTHNDLARLTEDERKKLRYFQQKKWRVGVGGRVLKTQQRMRSCSCHVPSLFFDR